MTAQHTPGPEPIMVECPKCGTWVDIPPLTTAPLTDLEAEMLEALREIHKLWCCPAPKTLRDWSARCDVMADYARAAIAKAEGGLREDEGDEDDGNGQYECQECGSTYHPSSECPNAKAEGR